MDTKNALSLVLVCFCTLFAGAQAMAQTKFCIAEPHQQVCPVFPEDQPDFSRFFEYRVINAAAQTPFDVYGWQAFVALNWGDVVPSDKDAHPGWRAFHRRSDVFKIKAQTCAGAAASSGDVLAGLSQSDGHSLIDQNGNFIVYETRLNDVAHDYVRGNALETQQGRLDITSEISFPIGESPSRPASVTTKTAWMILQDPDPSFIQATAHIHVPQSRSLDGEPVCLTTRVGLIGMHIVAKVASGHGDKWIWSTFEHQATVPTAGNAREINSIYAKELFPGGCAPPAPTETGQFLLFDLNCDKCSINSPPEQVLWAGAAPLARHANGASASPSQIVRCWEIFGPTQATNTAWQAKLSGTPLAYYQLVSAQWRGANPDPIFEQGELPRYLSNTAMESYIQDDPSGSCLGCHAFARTPEGAFSDFTFLFR